MEYVVICALLLTTLCIVVYLLQQLRSHRRAEQADSDFLARNLSYSLPLDLPKQFRELLRAEFEQLAPKHQLNAMRFETDFLGPPAQCWLALLPKEDKLRCSRYLVGYALQLLPLAERVAQKYGQKAVLFKSGYLHPLQHQHWERLNEFCSHEIEEVVRMAPHFKPEWANPKVLFAEAEEVQRKALQKSKEAMLRNAAADKAAVK